MEVSPSPIPWSRFAAFVRQFGHDIRNDLNALSLEAALLKELVADPEAVTSATRIQTQLREIANRLKELSGRYALPAPQLSTVSLNELAMHLQNAAGTDSLKLEVKNGEAVVHTDPALLARAFRELAVNAVNYATTQQKPQATLSEAEGGGGVLTLRETGEAYEWNEAPFASLRAGHYGAGLPIAASILKGLGVTMERNREGNLTETRIRLPKP
jgi:signal transduction histidine kinase